MKVTEAIEARRSVRDFLDTPVATETIVEALKTASRAPSGGNVQPWKIYVVNGERMNEFRSLMERRLSGENHPEGESREYDVYPPKLIEPYRTARFEVGEEMYGHLGIPREDRDARLEWFAENYRFFGAPAAIFCFFDRMMGAPQWADCGMFLENFMLLMSEAGLSTCAQECWYTYPKTVADFCGAPDNLMLFCGIAIGHEDVSHPVNRLRTKRLDPSEWLKVV